MLSFQPWSSPPVSKCLFLLIGGLAFAGIGLIFGNRVRRQQSEMAHLLRDGIAVEAYIIGKKSDPGEAPRYYVTYQYSLPNDDELRQREDRCTPEQWKKLSEGGRDIALINPGDHDKVRLWSITGMG